MKNNISNINSFLLLTFLFLTITPMSLCYSADGNVRIGILPFNNSTSQHQLDGLSDGLSDLLMGTLGDYNNIVIVERKKLKKAIQEIGLSQSGFISDAQVLEAGNMIGASIMLTGQFTLVDKKLLINVHSYDIETSKLLFSIELKGSLKRLGDLTQQMSDEIVDQLNTKINIQSTLPTEEYPQVRVHYINGLGYYYAQLYEGAIAEFMQAVSLKNDYPEARFWLGKSYYQNGIFDHAEIELKRFLKEFKTHSLSSKAQEMLEKIKKNSSS